MRRWIALALCVTICGCAKHAPEQAPGVIVMSPDGRGKLSYIEVTDSRHVKANDELQVTVDVVQVSAPAGSVSGQQSLWQIVDTGLFPADVQHRLNLNGVRVGVMSAKSWDDAKKVLELAPDVVSQTATLAGKSRVTLDARKTKQQTIFYFDRDLALQGRSYEEVQDLWGIHFAPDPTRPGNVSLELAPVIQSLRRHMRLNRAGEDFAVEYEQPETVLDMAITTSLPVGSVLVLAPSQPAISSATSIGRAFLMTEEEAGLSEQLFFLYPRVYRLQQKD